jgi:flavin reductase (DIM6/NTAB) family NADH-FMN oxidoreductase RutF
VNAEFIEKAHQTSAKYPEGVNEFEAVGLTPDYMEGVAAPFVKESIIHFACELVQRIPIEFNQTHFIIGKITQVMVPDSLVGQDGFIDLESAGTITCSGLDSYHTTKRLIRLPYAKP